MGAFIGLTSDDWFQFQQESKHDRVVFWTNRLIHLQPGAKFLFLCGIGQSHRYIAGYAIVENEGTCRIGEYWERFGKLCGAESLDALQSSISKATSMKGAQAESVGSYWVLEKFTPFPKPVFAARIDGEGRRRIEVFPGGAQFFRSQQIGTKIATNEADSIVVEGTR